MIKRAHECPLDIFDQVQKETEIDYFLVHLFETNKAYFEKAKEAVAKGREVILDNSLFELRESFDIDRFAYWIKELKPTYWICIDSWKNSLETIRLMKEFLKKYPKGSLPGKMIGVAQGNNFIDTSYCYKEIEPYCDKIAFNFDFSSYSDMPQEGVPNRLRMSVGRYKMLKNLYETGIINTAKPHHLLGVGCMQECLWYDRNWTWIDSVDTCNPVGEALADRLYNKKTGGPLIKNPIKMCDIMNIKLNNDQKEKIIFNIKLAKKMCQ